MTTLLVVCLLIVWWSAGYAALQEMIWNRRKRNPKHRKFKFSVSIVIVLVSPFIQIGEAVFDLICYLSKVVRNLR